MLDSAYSECRVRLIGGGQVEILALGAHVVVPINALALLPEAIARAVLAELAEHAGKELRAAAKATPAEEER